MVSLQEAMQERAQWERVEVGDVRLAKYSGIDDRVGKSSGKPYRVVLLHFRDGSETTLFLDQAQLLVRLGADTPGAVVELLCVETPRSGFARWVPIRKVADDFGEVEAEAQDGAQS